MTAFVLVVLLNVNVVMQDFSSEATCLEAAKTIKESSKIGVPVQVAFCVKK